MAQEAVPPPSPLPLPTLPTGGATSDGSVGLDKLLEVAVLTPAQAAHVAIELLTTASTIGQGRRSDVRVSSPQITADGEVHAAAVTDDEAGVGVDDVLAQLVDNARLLPARHPRGDQVALLERLDEVAHSSHEPAARALMLREPLDDALGPEAEPRLVRELAALVTAFGHVPESIATPVTPIRKHAVPPRKAPPTPPLRRAVGGRRARPPRRRALATVLVCLAVLGAGYYALGHPGLGILSGHHPTHHRPAGTAATQRHHHPQPAVKHSPPVVPKLAGSTAPGITGVQLQRLAPCRPGSLCPVRVTVDLTPAGAAQLVGWRVGAVRECTRHVTWSPLTEVTAQAGWTRVYAGTGVLIPTGHPIALVAMTTTPARAQSPPDRLAGSAPHC